MDYSNLKEVYEKRGYDDLQLQTIADIEEIYEISIEKIKGYATLSDERQREFQRFLINYYNTQGIIYRADIVPISIYHICQEDSLLKTPLRLGGR